MTSRPHTKNIFYPLDTLPGLPSWGAEVRIQWVSHIRCPEHQSYWNHWDKAGKDEVYSPNVLSGTIPYTFHEKLWSAPWGAWGEPHTGSQGVVPQQLGPLRLWWSWVRCWSEAATAACRSGDEPAECRRVVGLLLSPHTQHLSIATEKCSYPWKGCQWKEHQMISSTAVPLCSSDPGWSL